MSNELMTIDAVATTGKRRYVAVSGAWLGTVATWTLAVAVSAAYLALNVMGGEWAGVGGMVGGGLALLPVTLFVVAGIRNGAKFTAGWAGGLAALVAITFLCYGTDSDYAFVFAGFFACVFMGILVFWALAYRPDIGFLGTVTQRAGKVFQGVGKAKGGNISIMTALLVMGALI